MSRLLSREDAAEQVAKWKARGERVAFTNGCFDILHAGHVRCLEFARSKADRLVAALNTDASVKRLKGEDRPINNERDRAEVLAALRCVDAVVLFEEDTPLETIRALRPDVLVKGGEYGAGAIVGEQQVLSWGGEVLRFAMVDGYSTTKTIKRMEPER